MVISVTATPGIEPRFKEHGMRRFVDKGLQEIFRTVEEGRANGNFMATILPRCPPNTVGEMSKLFAPTGCENHEDNGRQAWLQPAKHAPSFFQAPCRFGTSIIGGNHNK
jgi:hypothetical protein